MEKQIVGNTGLYYVCYKLSERGWNVMPTARNARGVDVICFSSDAKRMLSVQVKSLSKRLAVGLGQNLDNVMGDFWIIVTSLASPPPRSYVLLPSEVREMAVQDKGGQRSYWLEPKHYAADEYAEKWSRVE